MSYASILLPPLLSILLYSTTARHHHHSLSTSSPPESVPMQQSTLTIYELLQKYNLPSGLFPDTVTSYSLSDDGSLKVDLAGHCYLDSGLPLYYKHRVKGTLRNGSIEDIKGIKSHEFSHGTLSTKNDNSGDWSKIKMIKVDTDSIYFYSKHWVTEPMPVSMFAIVPYCKSEGSDFKRIVEN